MKQATIIGLRVALAASIALWYLVFYALSCALGCGDNIDEDGIEHGIEDRAAEWLTQSGAVHGTVYRCESGAMCTDKYLAPATEEWCWAGDETALEAQLGVDAYGCWKIGPDERWWPWLVGCAYGCELHEGCNAHCGCACLE